MEYQKNGLKLSRFGLGCGAMTNITDSNEKSKSIKAIHSALDSGINLINTADFYGSGNSEVIIGEALKGRNRDDAFVAVKFGALVSPDGRMYGLDVSPLTIKNYITYSLKRLNLDYIDLYQPGRIDLGIPVEETIGVISDLVKEGYVKHIGLSQVDADTLRKANAVHPISFVESEYSLFNRGIETELLDVTRELGIDTIAFGVLAHGMLSGTASKDSFNPIVPLFAKENIEKNLSLVDGLKEIALEKQITLPQLALAWMLSKGEDIIPLIASRNVANLQSSIKSLAITLSETDIKRIENAIPKNEIAGTSFPNMKFRNGIVVP